MQDKSFTDLQDIDGIINGRDDKPFHVSTPQSTQRDGSVRDAAMEIESRLDDICGNDELMSIHDPYAFAPLMSDEDLRKFGEGNHFDIYSQLGAQKRTIDGVAGINFGVWAPNAKSLSVIGDFNEWDGTSHPMR